MKNMFLRLIAMTLLFSLPGFTYADGWIGQGKITTVHLRPDSSDFLIIHTIMIDKGCGQTPNYYRWDLNQNYSEQMLAMAMTAYAAQSPVNIHVKCNGSGHPSITQIVLQPN